MKRRFYHFAGLFVAVFLFSINLSAQHCASPSGPSVCTPQSGLTVQGFYPNYFDLPCAIDGVPYDTVISFKAPTTTLYSGLTATVDWIRIDSIENLPCGLCWRTNLVRDSLIGGQTACIHITGTTYDAPGQFKMRIIVDVRAHVGFIYQTLTNQDAEQFGIKYWAKVKANAAAPCIQIDTLSTNGNNRTTPGSIAAVSITGTSAICASGGSTTLTASGGTYDAYSWSTGAYTSSITATTTGTYTVTVFDNCNSASASVNVTPITVTTTLTPSGPLTFCSGGSVTLDAGSGFSAYQWSTGATSRTIIASQSGNYTCTVTQNGCTGTSNTVTVSVTTNPAPTLTANGPTTFCTGGNVTLDAGVGYSSYAWSNGGTNQTISATQSGNYTCTVTQNGCTGTSNTVSVTVNSNPVSTVNANGATTFCAGGSVTLDAGPGYSNYSWSNGGTTQTISATQSGNYTCTVTQNGCTGTSNTVTVTVNPLPTPVITPWGATSFCIGGDVWLNAPAGYDTYLWSSGATGSSYTATQTGNYNVTVTQNGCTGNSNSISVTVTDPTPTVTANGPTTFCTGGSVTLDAGAGFSAYAWSDATSNQATVVTQPGSYTVSTTLNGCVGVSSPVVVTVTTNNLSPAITATPSLNICPGGSATLDAGVGYTTYLWSSSSSNQSITESTAATYTVTVTQGTCSGTASATLNVGNFPVSVNISPAGPVSACTGDVVTLNAGGNYDSYSWSNNDITTSTDVTTTGSYIVTVTLNSCEGTDTVDVTFNSSLQPAISPSGPVNVCVGDVVTLDAGTYATYSWSNGVQTQTIQPTSSGSYSVTVTQNGCSGSDTVDVAFSAHPSVIITSADPLTVCEGTPITLDAGAGYDTYIWSNNEQTQTTQPASSGTYEITVTANGCDGTASVSVTINARPVVSVTPASPVSVCVGDNVTLDAGSGFTSYSWSNGDLTQTTQPTSTASYIVNVTQNGCSGADTVEVTFNAIPHAAISPSGTQTICSGQNVTLDAGVYSSYQWTTNETTQTIIVDTAGTYDVTVTQNGCTGSSTGSVIVAVNATPNATITELGTANGLAVLQANPANATYQWLLQLQPNGSYTFEANTAQTDTVTCGDVGEYHTVIVTQNGCSDTSAQHTVICVGIQQLASETKLNIMPNPANDVLNVSYDLNKASNVTISILDITGRRIVNVLNEIQNRGEHRQQIRLNDIAPGIYLLNLTTEFGNVNSKFVKQ